MRVQYDGCHILGSCESKWVLCFGRVASFYYSLHMLHRGTVLLNGHDQSVSDYPCLLGYQMILCTSSIGFLNCIYVFLVQFVVLELVSQTLLTSNGLVVQHVPNN